MTTTHNTEAEARKAARKWIESGRAERIEIWPHSSGQFVYLIVTLRESL